LLPTSDLQETVAPPRLNRLPSDLPPGFPINLRHTWQLVNQPRVYTASLRERFGDVVSLNRHGRAFVIALTPEAARQVLSADPDGYDAFWKEGFRGVAGPGSLWVLDGDRHRRERQILFPAFHAQHFRGYGEIIRQVAARHTDRWQPGEDLRAIDTALAISLEVIMRLVFGVQNAQFVEQGRRVLYNLWHTMSPMFVFFPAMQRGWFPPWRRYLRSKKDFLGWVNHILAERRQRNEDSDDVLGRMLAARYEDGRPMRDEDIRDELITLLLAGHETTATALSWALYDLGMNRAELERLCAELDTLGSAPDLGAMIKAPYLSAVCNETLRLHTLLPEVARVLVSPLELCGYTLSPGDWVGVSIMAIHHDPKLYPAPDCYQPGRFLDHSYDPFEFLPFGGGHRRCLGAALSDYEMRIVLAHIVTHWKFEPAALEREIRHDIAMGPKYGVRLHITGRRPPAFSTAEKID
jgi:cytochrome P450 family 110